MPSFLLWFVARNDIRIMSLEFSSQRDISPVLILGMHRSGTSCLAGCLQENGLYLGSVPLKGQKYNPKGNRENRRVRDLNDQLLKFNDGRWNAPPRQLRWTAEHGAIRDIHLASLARQAALHWGIKDPRFLITLPFWQTSRHRFRYVASFRHPLKVAASLNDRNGLSLQQGVDLWLKYNRALAALLTSTTVLLICFDAPEGEYRDVLKQISDELNLDQACPSAAGGFFDRNLRHHDRIRIDGLNLDEAQRLYGKLLTSYQEQIRRRQAR